MATYIDLTVNDTGFIKQSSGNASQRPGSPSTGQQRFNTQTKRIEFYNGTVWESEGLVRTGLTSSDPAPSGWALANAYPDLPSGYYWIKSPAMPNALQMYVDMVQEGGGYDFYSITGGINPNNVSSANSGTALGLDLVYPRSKFHWIAMSNFVRNVLGSSNNAYFANVGAVHRINNDGNGSGNYTGRIMRDPRYYGSGAPDWRVPDGGRWWLRDTPFSEPNGDYSPYGFLGGYSFPNPYTGTDLGFNDITGDGYRPGTTYLVSTNAKP